MYKILNEMKQLQLNSFSLNLILQNLCRTRNFLFSSKTVKILWVLFNSHFFE